MDAGLSRRMQATVDAGANYLAPQLHDTPTAANIIDLSSAQNEVLRPELLELFKSTTDVSFTSQAFGLTPAHGGDIQTREALASFLNKYFNPIHVVKSEQIALTAGATDALESIIHAVCDDGDSILIPGPYWYGLEEIAKVRPRVNVISAQPPTYDNYDNYLLPSLQAAYDFSSDHSRIKAVLICNPHNPTGRCYPKSTLLGLMEFCQERGLHLICDEVHALANLNHESAHGPDFVSALSLTEPLSREGAVKVDPSRVHVVWSASKLFGMSGFRVGALVSQQNPRILSAVSLLSSRHTSNVSTLYLHSLLTWTQLPTLLSLNSERLTASYHLLANFLESWRIDFVTPTHGLCLFARLAKNAKNATDEKRILDQLALQGVQVAQGRKFKGVERSFGWARIRFSVQEDVMRSALEKMDTFLCQTS